MKTDSQLQKDVMSALQMDPSISHEHIGVAAQHGVITLSGTVPSYFEKSAAEKTAQRVAGVRAIVEQIDVKIPGLFKRDDQSIAQALLQRFEWSVQVPSEKIQATVENGKVTLSGEVDWDFQRAAAVDCVKDLTGVHGVTNLITIKSRNVEPDSIKRKIESALMLEAEREAKQIKIDVDGNKVILSGNVHSFRELEDIKWAAWGTPGVLNVESKLTLVPRS